MASVAVGSSLDPEIVLGVSDFVAVVNQMIDYALPTVVIVGELSNFKVSKGRWVYFDLKDDESSVRFFGTVYMLPGPLEDGMMLEVRGTPRLHQRFGFSVNVQSIRPIGEGSLRKAAQLLQVKLTAEGLFAAERKRSLPYPPQRIGLVTSGESAAYADFMKILAARWGGIEVVLADVQVQGESAPGQIVAALQWFNGQAGSHDGSSVADDTVDTVSKSGTAPDVLVVIRGGGSADDLAAFSDERVVRAVAASRIPTLVAIGHEVDVSLAELAADQRGSTPSNAAELLVPDRREVLRELSSLRQQLADDIQALFDDRNQDLLDTVEAAGLAVRQLLDREWLSLTGQRQLAAAFDPAVALARGFAIVRAADGQIVRQASQVGPGALVRIGIHDADIMATVEAVEDRQSMPAAMIKQIES